MLTEGHLAPGVAFQAGIQHTAAGVSRAVGIVVIPVKQRRNVHTQLVVADPADIVEQVVVRCETETGAAIEAVTLIRALVTVARHVVELRTDAAANGKVQAAERIAGLWILLQQSDFCLSGERRAADRQTQRHRLSHYAQFHCHVLSLFYV